MNTAPVKSAWSEYSDRNLRENEKIQICQNYQLSYGDTLQTVGAQQDTKSAWIWLFMRLTGEDEGDGQNDKKATVETHAKGRPGQSRLKQNDE